MVYAWSQIRFASTCISSMSCVHSTHFLFWEWFNSHSQIDLRHFMWIGLKMLILYIGLFSSLFSRTSHFQKWRTINVPNQYKLVIFNWASARKKPVAEEAVAGPIHKWESWTVMARISMAFLFLFLGISLCECLPQRHVCSNMKYANSFNSNGWFGARSCHLPVNKGSARRERAKG